MRLHQAVALAFLGATPTGHEVNHINSDRHDCRPGNLEYVTRAGNIKHAFKKGRLKLPTNAPVGSAHHLAKLTPAAVRTIRTSTDTQTALALRFGVSTKAIRQVLDGVTWTHVGGPARPRVKQKYERRTA